MAVIELNLLNSQNEFSQMGEHFQDEHNLQKFSPKWESALPFGRKSPKLSVRPYCLTIGSGVAVAATYAMDPFEFKPSRSTSEILSRC